MLFARHLGKKICRAHHCQPPRPSTLLDNSYSVYVGIICSAERVLHQFHAQAAPQALADPLLAYRGVAARPLWVLG